MNIIFDLLQHKFAQEHHFAALVRGKEREFKFEEVKELCLATFVITEDGLKIMSVSTEGSCILLRSEGKKPLMITIQQLYSQLVDEDEDT